FEPTRNVDDSMIVTLDTTIPAAADRPLGTIDIFISVFDSDGRSVWSVRLTRDAARANETGTFNESTEMFLQKGKPYRVIAAVRDQTSGAIGVTQQVVRF